MLTIDYNLTLWKQKKKIENPKQKIYIIINGNLYIRKDREKKKSL